MSLMRAHIGKACCVVGCLLSLGGIATRTGHADTSSQQMEGGRPLSDGTYDLSKLGDSDKGYAWSPNQRAVLVGSGTYTGATLVEHGTVEIGDASQDGDINKSSNIYLPNKDAVLVINNNSETDLSKNTTGMGSIVFKGQGTSNVKGGIILMNPNPNENATKGGSTSGGKATFPVGLDEKPLSGDIVIRNGNVNITGSGINTGDMDFNPDKDYSLSGSIVDKNDKTLVGVVDRSGNLMASGDDEEQRSRNAARLQGFVSNNDYIIIGQADRGNMTVSNGAVVAADTSTVNVGLAASARGSTLTVDSAWFHAGILSIGNGDSTYDAVSYDNSQIPTQDNGALVVKNGGVVNSIVGVAGNYLGSMGGVHISGTSDPINHSVEAQSTFASTHFFVNGSGTGVVEVGDGTNANSGLLAVKNSIAFGVPGQDDLVGANKNDRIIQAQLKQKNGVLNLQKGGTVSVSNPRDAKGKIIDDAIYVANNEHSYQFNLNGGTLQRGTYNDIKESLSPLSTSVDMRLNETSFIDTNNGNILLSGSLSGAGGFIKKNQGTLVLTNQNSFTGDVTIERGAIQLSSEDGKTGNLGYSKALHLNNTDALLVNSSDLNTTVGQRIDGPGGVRQSGTGMTVLTGNNSYTGETVVDRGNLRINGNQAQATGQTSVKLGGTLSGSGTVGGPVVVHDTGAISAGGDDGDRHERLTIAGTGRTDQANLIIEKGGILNANLGSDKPSQDRHENGYVYHEGNVIYVTGKARFGEGSIINLSPNPGTTLRYNVGYRVLQSTNGIEGDLSKVKTSANYLFLNQEVGHEGSDGFGTIIDENGKVVPAGTRNLNAVDVILRRNSMEYSSTAITRNEREVGRALDGMNGNADLVQNFAQMTDRGRARQALNALSGEIHASLRTALIQDSFYTRQAVLDRLATADCEGPSTGGVINTADWQTRRRTDGQCVSDRAVWWGQAYGGMGHTDATFGTASMSHSVAGFIIGADKPLENGWRVGGLVGYAHSMMGVRGRASSGHSDDISIGAYAAKQWGPLSLRTGAIYTWNIINTRRQVDYISFHDKNNARQHGETAQAFAEVAYRFHPTAQSRIEPFINMAYVNLHTRNYTENGGQAALRGQGTDTGVGFVTAGVRASTRFWVGDAVVSPYGMVAYRHAFGDTSPTMHQNFVLGSSDMDINGAPLSEDTAIMDFGIQAQLTDMIDVSLSYLGQYGNRGYDNGGRANLRIHF